MPVELPYSLWNVLGLTFTAGTMAICGMVMYDIMLNMWSFNEPSGISTGVTNGILSALGMNK